MSDSPTEPERRALADALRASASLTPEARAGFKALDDAVKLDSETRAALKALGDSAVKPETSARIMEQIDWNSIDRDVQRLAQEMAARVEEAKPITAAVAQEPSPIVPRRRARRVRREARSPERLPLLSPAVRRDVMAGVKAKRDERKSHEATLQTAERLEAVRALLEELVRSNRAAEAREQAGQAREEAGERRERFMVRLTVAGVAIGAVGVIGSDALGRWAEFVAGLVGRIL